MLSNSSPAFCGQRFVNIFGGLNKAEVNQLPCDVVSSANHVHFPSRRHCTLLVSLSISSIFSIAINTICVSSRSPHYMELFFGQYESGNF